MKKFIASATAALVLCAGALVVGTGSASAVGNDSEKCKVNNLVIGTSSSWNTNVTEKQETTCGQIGIRIQYFPSGGEFWSAWKYASSSSKKTVKIKNPGYAVKLSRHTTTAPDAAYASKFPFTL